MATRLPVVPPPDRRAAAFVLELLEAQEPFTESTADDPALFFALYHWKAHVRELGEPGPCYWTPPEDEEALERLAELKEELVGTIEAQAKYFEAAQPEFSEHLLGWATWLRAGPPSGRLCPPWPGVDKRTRRRRYRRATAFIYIGLAVASFLTYEGYALARELLRAPQFHWVHPLSLLCPFGLFWVACWTLLTAGLHRIAGMRLEDA